MHVLATLMMLMATIVNIVGEIAEKMHKQYDGGLDQFMAKLFYAKQSIIAYSYTRACSTK